MSGRVGHSGLLMGPSVQDPYFADVGFLLHFDGADGSTTITDSSRHGRGFSLGTSGTMQISTAQSVFGGASWAHKTSLGYAYTSSDATYITAAGSTPWTLELRARFDSFSAAQVLFDTNDNYSNTTGWQVYVDTSGKIAVWDGYASTGYGAYGSSMSTSTWYAIALTWDGTSLRFFRGGVLLGTATGFTNHWGNQVFCFNSTYRSQGSNGYFDEMRFTKGVARYKADYSVASAAFPNA